MGGFPAPSEDLLSPQEEQQDARIERESGYHEIPHRLTSRLAHALRGCGTGSAGVRRVGVVHQPFGLVGVSDIRLMEMHVVTIIDIPGIPTHRAYSTDTGKVGWTEARPAAAARVTGAEWVARRVVNR